MEAEIMAAVAGLIGSAGALLGLTSIVIRPYVYGLQKEVAANRAELAALKKRDDERDAELDTTKARVRELEQQVEILRTENAQLVKELRAERRRAAKAERRALDAEVAQRTTVEILKTLKVIKDETTQSNELAGL
jgi:GDP-D-mannose dehydratase